MNKVALIVLDGWGIRSQKKGNAISLAKPEFFNYLLKKYPNTKLNASGKAVGLPKGVIGNSEVGHLHIAAGRVIQQDLERINTSIKNGEFYKNKIILNAFKHAKNSRLHFIGLLSDGGVHSHISHLLALMNLARKKKLVDVVIHAITDGRDVAQKSAHSYLKQVEQKLEPGWRIGSLMGRWYAMDRDNRWNREKKAYDLITIGKGKSVQDWQTGLLQAYTRGETDEFIQPTITAQDSRIRDGDVIVFFNFRTDRARELVKIFCQKNFSRFSRTFLSHLHFVCFKENDKKINAAVAYPQLPISNTLGEVISKKNIKQFRIAETEKWAHVTYFFNGLTDRIFSGEERLLIPSPKTTTYDKTPSMKAKQIANAVVTSLSQNIPFTLVNFANADMVGHTANINQCILAIKAVDAGLKKIVSAALERNIDVVITADHGNAEQLIYSDGSPMTSHTTAAVPFILVSNRFKKLRKIKNAGLANVAPTVLKIMGLPKPKEMKEEALI